MNTSLKKNLIGVLSSGQNEHLAKEYTSLDYFPCGQNKLVKEYTSFEYFPCFQNKLAKEYTSSEYFSCGQN